MTDIDAVGFFSNNFTCFVNTYIEYTQTLKDILAGIETQTSSTAVTYATNAPPRQSNQLWDCESWLSNNNKLSRVGFQSKTLGTVENGYIIPVLNDSEQIGRNGWTVVLLGFRISFHSDVKNHKIR